MIKIDFIIMAAGNSRRFGSNKLLYRIKGRPMFTYVMDRAEQAIEKVPVNPIGFDTFLSGQIVFRVFVVSRFDEILRAAEEKGWNAVSSPESARGASFTIKNGLRAAGDESDYYMFIASDQPCLQPDSIVKLIRETVETGKGIGSMCWQDQPGNPVMFHRKYLPELLALEGDTGGRKVVKKYPQDCHFCRAGRKEELMDADSPESMDIILDCMKKM